ncbi:MAG: hypothetical protein MI975_21045 [Cytophagales bacterium]|nr:hypothetical protein [Cytophagales bacterium]
MNVFGNLFVEILSIKNIDMDEKFTNSLYMEILTQPNNHLKFESETFFDKRSRESYFAMMKVALKNLSLVDQKESKIK